MAQLTLQASAVAGPENRFNPIPWGPECHQAKDQTLRTTMQAVRIHEFGGPNVLRYEEAPLPRLTGKDVLVQVHAAAVNPVDALVRSGSFPFANHPGPMVLGWDLAGTVADTGDADTRLTVGQAVFGRPALTRDGCYAEYIAVDPSELAPAPTSIPLEMAAALPLATLTAWKSLFDLGQLEAGQTALVHAGAGGVGTMAVQLAKRAGVRVVTTASGDGIDLARSLGADEVIDHTKEAITERGRFADVVLDTVGGSVLQGSYGAVRRGGKLISIAGAPDEDLARREGFDVYSFILESNGPRLAEVAALVDSGEIVPVVHRVLRLSEAERAHELMAAGHGRGKTILRVR